MKSARLAISVGCPCGIGPEVAVAAAASALEQSLHPVLVGDLGVLRRAAALMGIAPERLVLEPSRSELFSHDGQLTVFCPTEPLPEDKARFGQPSSQAGAAQLAWIDAATDLVVDGLAEAIVTGPVSKDVIAHSGAAGASGFMGHTEHIASRVGASDPVMVFVSGSTAVALVTTHLALARVPTALTVHNVSQATVRCAELLWRLGARPVRLVVASLNPHAGEHGLFGDEETRIIGPAISQAKARLEQQGLEACIEGPMGAEAAFRLTFDGAFDGAVAMYHDQGTIPMKLMSFGKAVNVTAGLPLVRTSVDHGTAYDIAGKGKADPGSMLEAMLLAGRLVRGA